MKFGKIILYFIKIHIAFSVLSIYASLSLVVGDFPYSSGHILDKQYYREKVRSMFYHAYNGYLENAYPLDELRPLTCDGVDTWGSFSLTLVDTLDTLVIMGNTSEFIRVTDLLVKNLDPLKNINVSVFETNIRIVGGLLSAHLLSRRAGAVLEEGWPCSGPLLHLAERFARRLLPAFETSTGMPYGTVNLRDGVPLNETPITCTAGVTTLLLEFGTLSWLTGDPIFEQRALRALRAMWKHRSPTTGLVGNHIDVSTGKWTAKDAGIGAGVDSYFEYLVKGAALFRLPELQHMFNEYKKAIDKFIRHDDWFFWVNVDKGAMSSPIFQSLEAFWPGLLSLAGHTEEALRSLHNYHQVWKQYGATPEFYSVPKSEAVGGRSAYPLRPELAESILYLYRATRDPTVLRMGVDIVESIYHSAKTRCGYATIHNVATHTLENRMESFFLAETTKYLYLLFDEDNFLHGGTRYDLGVTRETPAGRCSLETAGWIFNTEAHPLDAAALHCCSARSLEQRDSLLQLTAVHADLVRLLDLDVPDDDWLMHPLRQPVSKVKSDSAKDLLHKLIRGMSSENRAERNSSKQSAAGPELLTCASPPFHRRFQVYGEVYDSETQQSRIHGVLP